MKTTFSLLSVLCGVIPSALGADLYYSGNDGGWWEVAANWKVGSSTGPVSTAIPATGDTMYIGSEQSPISVKIGLSGSNLFFGMNINIASGSSLIVQHNDPKFWGSNITVGSAEGLVFESAQVYGDYKKNTTGVARTPLTFNLGSNGSVKYTGEFKSSSSAHFNFNGSLNILGGGDFSVQRRELMSFGTNGDALNFNFNQFNADFSAEEVETIYAQSSELTAAEEDLGKYKLVYAGADKKLYVEYVTGSQSIPEPSSSLLSLVCAGGLLMRRRR